MRHFRATSAPVNARNSSVDLVRRRVRRALPRLEALEDRILLSTVAWDGGGDGRTWHDAKNWQDDALPTSADIAVIGAIGVDVEATDLVRVGGLQSETGLKLGGEQWLYLYGPSWIHGAFVAGDKARILVSGANASLQVSAAASLDGASLGASFGGTISIPTLATYNFGPRGFNFSAAGTGSRIDLPNLASITGPTAGSSPSYIQTYDGGQINLAGVKSIIGGFIHIEISGSNSVNLSGLERWTSPRSRQDGSQSYSTLLLRDGGVSFAAESTSLTEVSLWNLGGGPICAGALLFHGGSLSTSGTLPMNITLDGAGIQPIGLLIIDGDLTIHDSDPAHPSGVIVFANGADMDHQSRLHVSGHLTLDGRGLISIGDPFIPELGSQITLITAGSITGMFASVSDLEIGHSRRLVPSYSATSVTLTTVFSSGPAVVGFRPLEFVEDGLFAVQVTFDDFKGTLINDKIRLTGPDGLMDASVTALIRFDPYLVAFRSSSSSATYTIRVGPDIKDKYGNPMNQDHDEVNGEPEDDVFTTSFTVDAPDLTVSQVLAPAIADPRDPVVISWTVTNAGFAAAAGSWTEYLYVSDDAAPDGLRLLGSFPFEGTIAPGASTVRTQAVDLPVDFFGQHTFLVRTDVGGTLWEFQNDNNEGSTSVPTDVKFIPMPNLQVASVQAPPAASSSQSISVQWVVVNAGDAATSSSLWHDAVYLSKDQILDQADLQLGIENNASYLDGGSSYLGSLTAMLPHGIVGDYFLIVTTDYHNSVEERGAESDNVRASQSFPVTLTPPPDLLATTVTVPAQAFSGRPISFGWTVSNSGQGKTLESFWYDEVILSSDASVDDADIVLGRFVRQGILLPGESYSRNVQLPLPVGVSGQFQLLVRVDGSSHVYEHAFEGNNVAAGNSTNILLTPPPDLEVSHIAFTSPATAGHAVDVSYRVVNAGATATPNSVWFDAIYLSRDQILDPAEDHPLGERIVYPAGGALLAGESYETTRIVTLPFDLVGEFYVLVQADARREVFEVDRTNNSAASAGKLTVESRPPDLTVTASSAPVAAQSGQTVRVSWTVANLGTGDTVASAWTDRIFATVTPVLDPAHAVLLADLPYLHLDGVAQAPLAAGAVVQRSELVLLPLSLKGTIYLFVVTDAGAGIFESREDNNSRTTGPLVVEQQLADLTVTDLIIPTNASAGSLLPVSWTVANRGTGITNFPWWEDSVYLSADKAVDANDRLLGTVGHAGALTPGAVYDVERSFRLPFDVPGKWYVLVQTDAANLVYEGTGELNNASASASAVAIVRPPTVDLAVQQVSAPAEGISGQSFDLTWTIRNQGTSLGAATWDDAVYLSRDRILDAATDFPLGSVRHQAALLQGQTAVETRSFDLPRGQTGAFYLLVVTDASERLPEGDGEGNNLGTTTEPMFLRLAPPADLIVGEVIVPADGFPGREATISFTVENQGTEAARGRWFDSIYLSADNQWDPSDSFFRRVEHVGDVLAGGAYSVNATAPLPGVAGGEYYVLVRSDIRNHVAETREDNNIGGSLTGVDVVVPTLALNVPVQGTLRSGESAYYRIEVAVGQTLLIDLDGQSDNAVNELTIRSGQLPSRSRFDFAGQAAFAADQRAVVPFTLPGVYYIQVFAEDSTGSGDFKIEARLLDLTITSSSPGIVSNQGRATLEVRGAQFAIGANFELQNGSAWLSPVATRIVNPSLAYITFDFTGMAAGGRALRVSRPGRQAVLNGAVQVTSGVGGVLVGSISGPAEVRPDRTVSMMLTLGNSGASDVPAPLLVVSSGTGTPFGSADGILGTQPRFLLGLSSSGAVNVIRPGQGEALALRFSSTTPTADFHLQSITADDDTIIDLPTLDRLRPSAFNDSQWTNLRNSLFSRFGGAGSSSLTLGNLTRGLGDVAQRLAARDETNNDARRLLGSALAAELGLDLGFASGEFRDEQTNAPVAGVTVVANRMDESGQPVGPSYSAVTDLQGRFHLDDLPYGDYSLSGLGFTADAGLPTQITSGGVSEDVIVTGQNQLPELPPEFGIPTTHASTAGPASPDIQVAFDGAVYAYSGHAFPEELGFSEVARFDAANGNAAADFQAYILKNDRTNQILVTFRGTAGATDALADASFGYDQWNAEFNGVSNRDRVFDRLRNLLAHNPDYKVLASGHSLGGGLTEYFAYEALRDRIVDPANLSVYTFNGIGGADHIIGYDPHVLSGATIRHTMVMGDLVGLAGNHIGDDVSRLPHVVGGHGLNFIAAHITGALQEYRGEFGNPGRQLDSSSILNLAGAARILNAVSNILNSNRNDGPIELTGRLLAAVFSLPLTNPRDQQKIARWLGDNIVKAFDLPEEVRQIIHYTPWPVVVGALEYRVLAGLGRFLPGGAQIFVGSLLAKGIFDLTKPVLFPVAAAAFDFLESIPGRLNQFEAALARGYDDVRAAADGLWDAAAPEFDAAYRSLQESAAHAWNEAAAFRAGMVDDLAALAAQAEAGLAASLTELASALSDFGDARLAEAVGFGERLSAGARELVQNVSDFFDALFNSEPIRRGLLGPIDDRYAPAIVVPRDPNDIVGPAGFGSEHWIGVQTPLDYTIRFENAPDATAPAQQVVVRQQLDADLDWRTFRFGDLGWGDVRIAVPAGSAFLDLQVDLRERFGFFVDVKASVDATTGIAVWTITTLDADTLEAPIDASVGFLPTNDSAGRGEGFLSYHVRARADAHSADEVSALAEIVFDTEAPIETNTHTNLLDRVAPTSSISTLPEFTYEQVFEVAWAGSDEAGASGVSAYQIYVSEDGGAFSLWLDGVQFTSAPFAGTFGRDYAFYAVALDNAGNRQTTPVAPQARTRVVEDAVAPTSRVTELAHFSRPDFTVSWTGADTGGSEIASYDVFVREGAGNWTLLLSAVQQTSVTYHGAMGRTYGFYSVAVDGAGNRQLLPSAAQAVTQVQLNTPATQYVAAVYEVLLKRAVDLEGLAYWSSRLDQGDDRSIVAALPTHSAEYFQTNVIKPAYLQFLMRAADQGGLDYWTAALQSGLTDEAMQAGFIASDEFYRIANHADAPVGVTPEHDRAWVDALYAALLGRGPDTAGEDFWTAQLQGRESRLQVANHFTGSTEGLSVRIQSTYQRYLGRAADAGGLAYWLERYRDGAVNEDIVTGFIGSDEFYRQATSN